MTEKQLEEKLVKAVKNRGGIAYKFTSPSRTGVPDRLVVLPGGKIGFVEVKKPKKGKLSKIQKRELKKLTALKCKCYVLNDPLDIQSILVDINVGEFKGWGSPQWGWLEDYKKGKTIG